MFPDFKLLVDIPSLDRLINYLEGAQQKKIDLLTAQLQAATQSSQQSRTGLDEAIQTQKET